MGLRRFSKTLVFIGFSFLFGLIGWWGAFYGDVVLASGFASPDPRVLLPCLYPQLGACAFSSELSSYNHVATALWITVGVLLSGLLLRLIPERTPSSVIPTLAAQREPITAASPQVSTAERVGHAIRHKNGVGKDQDGAKRANEPKQIPRQMKASSPYARAPSRYGPSRSVAAAEAYSYMDTGRSNLAVIGLALIAAVAATTGLRLSFPSMPEIEGLAPHGALAVRSVDLAEFPKPVTVLSRGQIFRNLQFTARGELVGEDQTYFVALNSSKVAIVDSRSGRYRALLEVNDGQIQQLVVIRRGNGKVLFGESLKETRTRYDSAISFSPSEERLVLKASDPHHGESLIVMDIESGEKHVMERPAFPKSKKGDPAWRMSLVLLDTLSWLSDAEVQYLAAFECLELGKARSKSKCQAGEIELYSIKSHTAGPVVEAKQVASFAKPVNAALGAFVTDQFRARLAAYEAMPQDSSGKLRDVELKTLAEAMAAFAEKRSLDSSNPFSRDVVTALFQDQTS